jgi:hypothetical protein
VASKLVVPTAEANAPAARQSVAGPFWWWSGSGDGGGPRRLVTAFAGSAPAQAWLGTATGDPRRWLDRLLALEPGLRPEGPPRLASWAADPHAGGAYAVVTPASASRLGALERPFGRVVLAGEHTAGLRWHGTFEGAVRSGRRAAAAMLELLQEAPGSPPA